ncbi:hypothetical protein BJX70DRAFT_45916 [Aspergillus crustosus]
MDRSLYLYKQDVVYYSGACIISYICCVMYDPLVHPQSNPTASLSQLLGPGQCRVSWQNLL